MPFKDNLDRFNEELEQVLHDELGRLRDKPEGADFERIMDRVRTVAARHVERHEPGSDVPTTSTSPDVPGPAIDWDKNKPEPPTS